MFNLMKVLQLYLLHNQQNHNKWVVSTSGPISKLATLIYCCMFTGENLSKG